MFNNRGSSRALVLVACLAGGFASASEPHALAGSWSVDVSRIEQPDPPKSVTLTLTALADGLFRIAVDIESADGHVMHSEGEFKPDGNAVRVEGSMDVDVVSMSTPNSRTLVMAGGFRGHPSSSRVWTLSDDGKEMIEIAIRHLPDGTPYMRKFRWTRK